MVAQRCEHVPNVTGFYSTQNYELVIRKLFNQRRRQTTKLTHSFFYSALTFLRRNVVNRFTSNKYDYYYKLTHRKKTQNFLLIKSDKNFVGMAIYQRFRSVICHRY